MNLWVRSQLGGCLIKVSDLKIMELDKEGFKALNDEEKDGFWSIIANDGPCVGKYKTKERAIEVLNEIQELICPMPRFIVSQHIDFADVNEGLIGCTTYKEEPKIEKLTDDILYQMPKE